MCYEIEVLELQDDKAIITVGESKFVAYHDTEVEVSEGFTDFWDFTNDCHYTRPNGKYEVDAMTNLGSLYVVLHEDGDEMLDIHIPSDRIEKQLKKEIENSIASAAIAQKEQELENDDDCFDWSVGHVSHYYV